LEVDDLVGLSVEKALRTSPDLSKRPYVERLVRCVAIDQLRALGLAKRGGRERRVARVPEDGPPSSLNEELVAAPAAPEPERTEMLPSRQSHDFDRDRDILALRAGGFGWAAIGARFGISGKRTSELHARAVRRLEGARVAARRRGKVA
jgi:hypothetical protein